MTSLDVKVRTIDNSAPYLPPSRALEIRTKKGSIFTPNRASTSYEFKKKAQVPTDIPIHSEISVNIQKLNFRNLQRLLVTNGYADRLGKKIDLNNRLEQYSTLRVSLLQPTVSPTRDPKTKRVVYPSAMNFLKGNPVELNKFIRILISIQHLMGLDLITIPFLDLPLATMKQIVSNIDKSLERINRQPLFIIDMKYHSFSQIIELIAKDLQSNMIGLIFRDYMKSVQSYETLFRYADADIAFFAIRVSRSNPDRYDISTMHYLPFVAGDVYSVVTPSPFIPSSPIQDNTEEEKEFDRLRNIRLFARESLQINQIRYFERLDEKIQNEYREDRGIRTMLENYHEAETDARKYAMLNAFSRVDELKSSLSEFSSLQGYIKQESAKDYLQEKTTLQKALEPIFSSRST